MINKCLLIKCIFLLILNTNSVLFAQPIISSVAGTISHKSTITIGGSGFGTKSPATPLWWDDGEGATDALQVPTTGEITWATSTLTGSNKHYNDAWPRSVTENSGTSNIRYRTAPYRNVTAPHNRSTKFITGGHDDEGECLGGEVAQNVGVTLSDGTTHPVWYIHYYLRLDPLFPTNASVENNYKFFCWERTPPYTMYNGGNWSYDNWTACGTYNASPSCGYANTFGRIYMALDATTCSTSSPSYGVPFITYNNIGNPINKWQVWEHLYKNGGSHATDVFKLLVDNITAVDISLDSDCVLNGNARANEVGGVTIGGFWRSALCDGHDNLDDNAWRYFDDVYVDTTFSRIILTNNQYYDNSTIIEPQIPSAWNNNAIIFTVNLGKLPDSGTAYLFVFDANNNHNALGFPVVIGGGGGDNSPPSPPSLKF